MAEVPPSEPIEEGVSALDSLLSHDYDLLVIDETDGVGLISGEERLALVALRDLLRDAHVVLALSADDAQAVESCLTVATEGEEEDGNPMAARGWEIAVALRAHAERGVAS